MGEDAAGVGEAAVFDQGGGEGVVGLEMRGAGLNGGEQDGHGRGGLARAQQLHAVGEELLRGWRGLRLARGAAAVFVFLAAAAGTRRVAGWRLSHLGMIPRKEGSASF